FSPDPMAVKWIALSWWSYPTSAVGSSSPIPRMFGLSAHITARPREIFLQSNFSLKRSGCPVPEPAADDADGSLALKIAGISFAADRLRRAIATVATEPGAVLLLGPTGSGKEVAANAIHRES